MLPALIEYLSSQEGPRGGRLCRPGRLQFTVPVIPPFAQINFLTLPPIGADYAIKFAMSYDCVPGALYVETTQAGDMYVRGTIEASWMREEWAPYYVLYSKSDPLVVLLRNTTPLNQRFIGTQYILIIDTADNLNTVRQHLAAYSAVETNRLLVSMENSLKKLAGPSPPIAS